MRRILFILFLLMLTVSVFSQEHNVIRKTQTTAVAYKQKSATKPSTQTSKPHGKKSRS